MMRCVDSTTYDLDEGWQPPLAYGKLPGFRPVKTAAAQAVS